METGFKKKKQKTELCTYNKNTVYLHTYRLTIDSKSSRHHKVSLETFMNVPDMAVQVRVLNVLCKFFPKCIIDSYFDEQCVLV